jgi:hypothetical protein
LRIQKEHANLAIGFQPLEMLHHSAAAPNILRRGIPPVSNANQKDKRGVDSQEEVAERVGFEPTVVFSYARFPGVCLKPLSHLSNQLNQAIQRILARTN